MSRINPTSPIEPSSRDDLERRLAGALSDVGRHAPSAPPLPAALQPTNDALQKVRRTIKGRTSIWAKPAMAAAAVLVTVGMAGMVGAQQMAANDSEETGTVNGPAESGGIPPSELTTSPAPGSRDAADRIATRLVAYADEPGFGRVVIDYDHGRVVVLWNGEPPQEVVDMAQSQPDGVRVAIIQSEYSQAELSEAANSIMDASASEVDDAVVVAAAPNSDLSGLVIEIVRPWDGSTAKLERVAGGVSITVRLVDQVTELGRG